MSPTGSRFPPCSLRSPHYLDFHESSSPQGFQPHFPPSSSSHAPKSNPYSISWSPETHHSPNFHLFPPPLPFFQETLLKVTVRPEQGRDTNFAHIDRVAVAFEIFGNSTTAADSTPSTEPQSTEFRQDYCHICIPVKVSSSSSPCASAHKYTCDPICTDLHLWFPTLRVEFAKDSFVVVRFALRLSLLGVPRQYLYLILHD